MMRSLSSAASARASLCPRAACNKMHTESAVNRKGNCGCGCTVCIIYADMRHTRLTRGPWKTCDSKCSFGMEEEEEEVGKRESGREREWDRETHPLMLRWLASRWRTSGGDSA